MAKPPKSVCIGDQATSWRLDTRVRATRPGRARGKQPVRGKANGRTAGPVSPVPAPRPFRHAVFASEAEYDRSVASVVARIHSGQVQARTPDE